MLVNLDVFIGLSVVMLGLSLLVTLIGQATSNFFAVRGSNLRWGLSVLIQELHARQFPPPGGKIPLFGLDLNQRAKALVSTILGHPLVSDSKFPFGWWKLATAVRFDEFVKTITMLGKASEEAKANKNAADSDITWLSKNSLLTEPWFNSVMDRVSQRFVVHMRIYTVVISVLVVGAVRVDTLHVLKTLRSDAALRSGLVSAAQEIGKGEAPGSTNAEEAKKKLEGFTNNVIAQLPEGQSIGAILRPQAPGSPSLAGLLLSAMLLSLGAPFWFNMLKSLTALRPIIAAKEEKERTEKTSAPDVGDGIKWKDL